MEKTVKFYNRGERKTEYYVCDIEEIDQDKEEDFINSDVDIVKWNYGWGDKGYFFKGKLKDIIKYQGKKINRFWLFKHPDNKIHVSESMYYDESMRGTRNKLYKLIKVNYGKNK